MAAIFANSVTFFRTRLASATTVFPSIFVFPKISNSGSPPAKPGGQLSTIKPLPQIRGSIGAIHSFSAMGHESWCRRSSHRPLEKVQSGESAHRMQGTTRWSDHLPLLHPSRDLQTGGPPSSHASPCQGIPVPYSLMKGHHFCLLRSPALPRHNLKPISDAFC